MSGCRIRSVTDKRSGRRLDVLNRPERKGFGKVLVEHAVKIADMHGEELAGFAVVGFDKRGAYSFGCRFARPPSPNAMPMAPTLMPAFVAEIMRREVVMEDEIGFQLVRYGLIGDEPGKGA